jgi:hypothetical protein
MQTRSVINSLKIFESHGKVPYLVIHTVKLCVHRFYGYYQSLYLLSVKGDIFNDMIN